MKLLTVTVPCYNGEAYLENCVASLLDGGSELEILIVDDGSTDRTAAIADRLQAAYPDLVRAIHQPNAGHGGAVNTGLANASGLYFRVVDSDDWVDPAALHRVLETLRTFREQPVDLLVTNYIYDKVGVTHKKTVRYGSALPEGRILQWDSIGRFHKGQYLLMHALTYRTALLRECGLELPLHTFYVDNIFAYTPLASVQTMYYLDVDLYHYCIGREDQSVQEATMIRRIDQQLRVNRLMMEQVDLQAVQNRRQRRYLLNYLEIITSISTVLLLRSGTEENLRKKQALWEDLRQENPWLFRRLRYGVLGICLNLPGKVGRNVSSAGYRVSRRVFGFN